MVGRPAKLHVCNKYFHGFKFESGVAKLFYCSQKGHIIIQLYILNGGEPLEATRNCETKFHDYKRKGVLLGDRNGVSVTSALSLSLPVCH